MTKERLTVLGLNAEQAQAVLDEWEAGLADYVPKADYDALEAAKGTIEAELDGNMKLFKKIVKDAKGSTLEEQADDFLQIIGICTV